MNVKWDYQLKEGQSGDPVVFHRHLSPSLMGNAVKPSTDSLLEIFQSESYRLQTWGRAKDGDGKTITVDDPHWIAVRGSTPLHVDPRYPRYSHHLKVRVDPGVCIMGLAKKRLPLSRGTYYVLDTHSPHQVLSPKGAWNVAVSLDRHAVTNSHEDMINLLLEYAGSAPFIPPGEFP